MKYQRPLDLQYSDGMKSDFRFRLVVGFLERWGMVTGYRGQEDSSGRAGLELMPVEEVIGRAFAMAELAVVEAERRGWLAEFDMDPVETHERIGEFLAAKEAARMDAAFFQAEQRRNSK